MDLLKRVPRDLPTMALLMALMALDTTTAVPRPQMDMGSTYHDMMTSFGDAGRMMGSFGETFGRNMEHLGSTLSREAGTLGHTLGQEMEDLQGRLGVFRDQVNSQFHGHGSED